ncbi:MAG TPA: hypothetical protein VE198_20755 [Actinoallomurus sp.]|nr:hypothetical protein [Actinoallomurus sp.]
MTDGTVIRVRRSRWRGAYAVLFLVPWGVGLPLAAVALGLEAVLGGVDLHELAIAALAGALSIVTVPIQVHAVRMLLARPRVTLETDALVIHDPVLLGRDARIRRELVMGAERLRWKDAMVSTVVDYDTGELSLFREPLNLEIVLSEDHIFTSARRRETGLWIWRTRRRLDRAPQFPEPGDRYRRLRLRIADPAAAVTAIAEWAAASPGRREDRSGRTLSAAPRARWVTKWAGAAAIWLGAVFVRRRRSRLTKTVQKTSRGAGDGPGVRGSARTYGDD